MSQPAQDLHRRTNSGTNKDEARAETNTHSGCSCGHHHQEVKPIRLFSMYPDLEIVTPKDVDKSPLHAILMDDNKFIWSGYRKLPVNDYIRSFWSMFTLHNETMNIWTHLVPSFIYLMVAVFIDRLVVSYNPDAKWMDRASFVFYCVTGVFTFGFSAMYHTWRMNSIGDYHFCLLCDIRGISVLVTGANALTIAMQMKDYESLQYIYSGINLVASIVLLIWIRKMVRERLVKQRTFYFTLHALMPLMTLLHRLYLQTTSFTSFLRAIEYSAFPKFTHEFLGISHAHVGMKIKDIMWVDNHSTNYHFPNGVLDVNHALGQLLVLNYGMLAFGMFLRGYKAPERWVPFKFDLFGASHQIFHVLSVLSSFLIVYGMFNLYTAGGFPDAI